MSTRTIEGTSARKASWIIVLLLLAWVIFLFAPFPLREKPAPTSSLPPIAAQSKLESVGLANNPDWQGLPDYFVIWAGQLEWRGDKTVFAYWNPGSNSYSYLFEATRGNGRYRFRAITSRELVMEGNAYCGTEDGENVEEVMGRTQETSTHPFVFFRSNVVMPVSPRLTPSVISNPGTFPQVEVPVDLKPEKLTPAKTPGLEKSEDATSK